MLSGSADVVAMEELATPVKRKRHKAMNAQQQKENLAKIETAMDRARQAGEQTAAYAVPTTADAAVVNEQQPPSPESLDTVQQGPETPDPFASPPSSKKRRVDNVRNAVFNPLPSVPTDSTFNNPTPRTPRPKLKRRKTLEQTTPSKTISEVPTKTPNSRSSLEKAKDNAIKLNGPHVQPKDNPNSSHHWRTKACVTLGSMHPTSEAIIVGLRNLATVNEQIQGIVDAARQLLEPRAKQEGVAELIQEMEELKVEWLEELGGFFERRRRAMGNVVTRAGVVPLGGVDVLCN